MPRSMLVFLVLVMPSCGYVDLPIAPERPCTEADAWQIYGFDGNDVGADGDVQLSVGESHELRAAPVRFVFGDCDSAVASVRWSSSSSRVASFGPGTLDVWLTARNTGVTEVRADVTLTTGSTYPALLSVFNLATSQDVHTIRVVASASPAGRKVIFSRSVTLEPSPGTAGSDAIRQPFEVPASGTLDIVVDWQSTRNRIIPHLCPGLVPADLGCVPVIDGNLALGEKPVTGSAKVRAGTYTFWITNEGPGRETVTYEAGLLTQ